MSASKKSASAGFPVATVLCLIFVTLKLAGVGTVATWSWWWVLSPLWIVAAIVVLIIAVFVLVTLIVTAWNRL